MTFQAQIAPQHVHQINAPQEAAVVTAFLARLGESMDRHYRLGGGGVAAAFAEGYVKLLVGQIQHNLNMQWVVTPAVVDHLLGVSEHANPSIEQFVLYMNANTFSDIRKCGREEWVVETRAELLKKSLMGHWRGVAPIYINRNIDEGVIYVASGEDMKADVPNTVPSMAKPYRVRRVRQQASVVSGTTEGFEPPMWPHDIVGRGLPIILSFMLPDRYDYAETAEILTSLRNMCQVWYPKWERVGG